MAKVRQNIIIQGLSGSLGDQLVIKQDRAGRTIVSSKPVFNPNRSFTDSQKSQQDSFREAVLYARSAKNNPLYIEKAAGNGQSPFNAAVADWFHAPEVLDIDLSAWAGQIGQVIRIRAMDDVQVVKVIVVVTSAQGTILEQGTAIPVDGLWWEYTATVAVSGSLKVLASAQDLPGHVGSMTKTK